MVTSFSSYSAGEFLIFYALLMVGAVGAGFWIPAFLRPDGRAVPVTDADELGWLAGGHPRFVDTVLSRLLGRGALTGCDGKLAWADVRPSLNGSAERALGVLHAPFSLRSARSELRSQSRRIEAGLISRELVMNPAELRRLILWSVLPYLIVILVGIYRRQAGLAQEEPTGFLTAMIFVTAVMGIARLMRFDPRTHGGQQAVSTARGSNARLEIAATEPELDRSVALFGTAVLVGTPYASLHTMRQNSGEAGSGCGGDSGSDGGSGCGGGCGGCGG